MKMAMRPRYYCDFCKKVGGNPASMKKHEASCTNRPDRVCGMCSQEGHEQAQTPLNALIPLAVAGDIDGLRKAANGCPACMLAAIRQAPWMKDERPLEAYMAAQEALSAWKFKDECVLFWSAVNWARVADARYYV